MDRGFYCQKCGLNGNYAKCSDCDSMVCKNCNRMHKGLVLCQNCKNTRRIKNKIADAKAKKNTASVVDHLAAFFASFFVATLSVSLGLLVLRLVPAKLAGRLLSVKVTSNDSGNFWDRQTEVDDISAELIIRLTGGRYGNGIGFFACFGVIFSTIPSTYVINWLVPLGEGDKAQLSVLLFIAMILIGVLTWHAYEKVWDRITLER